MTEEHNGTPPDPDGELQALDDGWSDAPAPAAPEPTPLAPQTAPAAPEPTPFAPQAAPARQQATTAETELTPRLGQLRLYGRTDVGQIREHNEDNFVIADLTTKNRALQEIGQVTTIGPYGVLLAVCDGMGGAAAGEVASQLAVDIIAEKMSAGDPPTDRAALARRLNDAVEAAGARIYAEANADRARRGMGTTATISALIDDHLLLAEVGDSRGYILRGDKLVQVTRDQSLVNQLIEAGQLTEIEAETFEHNNIILQALGTAETVQVDITYVELRRGDTLLLCSDGLSGMVRFDEIREVLRTFDDLQEICKQLIDRANQAGGHDNITVVVATFEGDWLRQPSPDDEELKYKKYSFPDSATPPPAGAPEALHDTGREFGVPANWQLQAEAAQNRATDQAPGKSKLAHTVVGAQMSPSAMAAIAAARAPGDKAGPPTPRDDSDPILIPTSNAPAWVVGVVVLAALALATIAGYYLLR